MFQNKMVRTYTRKTQRQNWEPEAMQQAIAAVRGGMAINTASKQFAVPRMSLKRRVSGVNKVALNEKKSFGKCSARV